MTKKEIDRYINKKVELIFCDEETVYEGVIRNCRDTKYKNDINIWCNGNKCYCIEYSKPKAKEKWQTTRIIFKASIVKSIRVIGGKC